MDNLGTEVGHKMRSAVKAKLIELGTGGAAGYIDDELPDYVMIMVANKRSKQQMIEDLSLFLGSNTDAFVNWLHQVLEKLQEVTLSTNNALQKKRKTISESNDKKDKKDKKKKLKRNHKLKSSDTTAITTALSSTTTTVTSLSTTSNTTNASASTLLTSSNSITDVFADQLLQKAKTSSLLEQTANVKTKNESALVQIEQQPLTPPPPPPQQQSSIQQPHSNEKSDDFDIPTISEIAKNSVNVLNRRRDLNELAELQKKINQAKKQLKALGQDESEDEDCIDIEEEDIANEDDENDDEGTGKRKTTPSIDKHQKSSTTSLTKSQRIPITFRHDDTATKSRSLSISPPPPTKKRSIMDRLGVRPTSATGSAQSQPAAAIHQRRSEKEIYVPVFRRSKDDEKRSSTNDNARDRDHHHRTSERITRERERERDRDRSHDKRDMKLSRDKSTTITSSSNSSSNHRENRVRDLRDRVREKNEKSLRNDTKELQLKNKIGSRCIVAPPKPEYDEDAIEVPVNSIVKVQPRPVVPNSKQASKNLLLRAVAEAQKSTALCKIQQPEIIGGGTTTNDSCSNKNDMTKIHLRNQKLYTKSYRDTKSKKLKDADNIVIEVSQKQNNNSKKSTVDQIDYNNSTATTSEVDFDDDFEIIEDDVDPEDGYVYIPLNISSGHSDEEDDEADDTPQYDNVEQEEVQTQFVITINDDIKNKYGKKTGKKLNDKNGIDKTNHSSSSSRNKDDNIIVVKKEIDNNKIDESSVTVIKSSKKRKHLEKVDRSEKASSSPLRTDITSQKVNKLIIKNDTEDEEELRREVERSTTPSRRQKRSNVSPIKFDIADENLSPSPKRSSGSSSASNNNKRRKSDEHLDNRDERVLIKRSNSMRKYDDLPPLPSAILSVPESSIVKSKSKERCKYYPTCGKGDQCEFVHPTQCKAFPNCKYGDQCLYYHPKCKFDLTCTRLGCNFSHTPIISAAPPLSSHVVPVTNYKSITASSQRTVQPLPAMCKFYPKCTNTLCTFFHPKPCRFGKNCINKVECNFYHFDLPNMDKLKWVAS